MSKDFLRSKLGNVHHGAMFGQGFVRTGHGIVRVEIVDGIVGRLAKVAVAISSPYHTSLLEGIQQGQLTLNIFAELVFDGGTGFISGERTFMGHANYGEDINWETDDFQVEIANFAPVERISVDLAQVEMRFILAQ